MGSLSPSSSPLERKRCPEYGFSGITASLIDLRDTHEDPLCHGHNDADVDVNAPLPCPVQIEQHFGEIKNEVFFKERDLLSLKGPVG